MDKRTNELEYLRLLKKVLLEGKQRGDRTAVGVYSLFGEQLKFDLRSSFPLLTTKKIFFRGVIEELLWFLSGSTDNTKLQEKNVHIWDEWATSEQCGNFGRKENDLGPVYGHQWRNFGAIPRYDENFDIFYKNDGVDQISKLVEGIKKNPLSRRHIVTGWNPREADLVALPPCHTLFQFYVQDGELSCHLYQRSGDMFLGVPFNIASYAALTHMIAKECSLKPDQLIISFGDVHVYKNHEQQVLEQLRREVRPGPQLRLKEKRDIFSYAYEDFSLDGYDPHPKIEAPVAV